MSDLISRQEAIDRINKQREHLEPDVYPQDKIADAAYRICAEFIERLPSAQSEHTETHSCDYQRTETHDLVSRRAAIKIAKNVAYYVDEHGSANGWLAMLVNWLEILPSAQPEIIRCKDCKHFKQVFAPNDNDGLCGHWHSKCDARTNRNGYCSHAERREDGTRD